MKFVELKKSLKENVLSSYLLLGNDAFLLQKSYELIKESLPLEPLDLNLIIFNENIDCKLVVKALETMPIFAEKKLVYVNASVKTGELVNLSELVAYLKNPNPSSVLVINAGNSKQEFLSVVNLTEVVDCNKLNENVIAGFIHNELKKYNKTISASGIRKLCEFCIYDLTSINGELHKLVSYIGTRTQIEEDDILQIVTKNLEYQIFDLTESLAKKNSDKVYELLKEIRSKKDNEKMLLPLISNHFRRLLHVSLNYNNLKELPKLLKVKEYAVTVAVAQAKLFTQRSLRKICDLALSLDFEVKSGEVLSESAVNMLVLQILNL